MYCLVHESAAVTLPGSAPCCALIIILAVAPADIDGAVRYLAVFAFGDVLSYKTYDGQITVDMAHCDLKASLSGELIDLACFGYRHRHGLLEKKIAAVLHSIFRDLEMKTGRNRNGYYGGLDLVYGLLIVAELLNIRKTFDGV